MTQHTPTSSARVLPFPQQPNAPAPPPAPAPAKPQAPIPDPRNFVTTTPAVGYNGVTLTYWDADCIPRIQVVLDVTVGNVDGWRRMMQRTGDQLPPLPAAARRPLPVLGPHLIP